MLNLIRRDKGVDAAVGLPVEWEGSAGVDTLNRLLNDEEPAASGIGVQLVDREHNLPESGEYVPPVDFKPKYEAAWGVG